MNEQGVTRLLWKFIHDKTLSSADSRRLINAVIRDELTTWQYLKVKIPPAMQNDLPTILARIVGEAHDNTKTDDEFFYYVLDQLKKLYVPMFKSALGIEDDWSKVIVICPNCSQKLRVPSNRSILVTCAKCSHKFKPGN
jgi:hypothetical protein